MSNKIGKKIKELRLDAGLSQPELAKKINVANSVISNWENATNTPRADYIISLAKIFKVSTDYILGLENEDGTKIEDNEEEYVPIVARSKDNKQRNLTISKSELKKIIAEAIEYTNKNKDK